MVPMTNTKKWMPFYVSTYLADTTHLSTIEHGAYALILFHLWQGRKPIKDSDDAFQRITKTTPEEWSKMRDVILELLTKTADGWAQKRLTIEAERAEKAYKKRVKTITDLNNKRKGLARSSRGKRDGNRNDERHIIYSDDRDSHRDSNRPTSTLSKERVVAPTPTSGDTSGSERTPSGPSARPSTTTAPQDPYAHGFVDKHGRVVVRFPDGVVLKISDIGSVDLIDHDREAIIPQMTTDEALALRNRVLAGEGPQTLETADPLTTWANVAPLTARPVPQPAAPYDPVAEMPAHCVRSPEILAAKQGAS